MNAAGEMVFSLVAVVFGLVILTVAGWLVRFNRKKGIVGIVLGVVFLVFALPLLVLSIMNHAGSFSGGPVMRQPIVVPAGPKGPGVPEPVAVPAPEVGNDLTLIMDVGGQRITAVPDDEITIRKGTPFVVREVKSGKPIANLKANIVGFIGNARVNDGQDIGYTVRYKDMQKRKALDKNGDAYKIDIQSGENIIGTVLLKFTD